MELYPYVRVGLCLVTETTGAPEAGRDHSILAALKSPRRLRTETLAGLVVALALIPEAIAFSIIAGVDPRVGLFASFTSTLR